MVRVNVWDLGARPWQDCTAALKCAVAAVAACGGGDVIMPYGDPGEYHVQPDHLGRCAVELASGVYLHGSPDTPITSVPGGKVGPLVGVQLLTAAEPSVQDCGLVGVSLRNDGVSAGNESHHAAFFGAAKGQTIRGVLVDGVRVLGVAWGDGLYFGAGVSDVHVRLASVQGCYRHGVTLAHKGGGGSRYVIEDVDMGETQGPAGRPFGAEIDIGDITGVQNAQTYDEAIEAWGMVRDVTLSRCHFAGGYVTFSGVSDWRLVECTSRPRNRDGVGGGVVATARGSIERCTLITRPPETREASRKASLSLSGGLADDVTVRDSTLVLHRCTDESLPPAALHARTHGLYPGWPDRLRVERSILLAEQGVPLTTPDHKGQGWDLSGLRHIPAVLS